LEAFQSLGIASYLVREEFECDKAAGLGVLGFIDDTHAATAELFENAVLRNELTFHEWAGGM
jgi:hypothetical protein